MRAPTTTSPPPRIKLAHDGFNEWFARKSFENDVSTPEQRITEAFQSCFARTRHLLVERGAWQHGGITRTRYWARRSPEQRVEGDSSRFEAFRFKDCASYDPPEPPPTDEVPWKEKDKYGNAVYSVSFNKHCSHDPRSLQPTHQLRGAPALVPTMVLRAAP